ncbi:MAG: 2TM domain-containing protein [Pseudomonadota bacterium]
MNQAEAKKRVLELKNFRGHLAAYVAVNLFLVVLNLITSPGDIWFFYPLLGWGIGLGIHAVNTFWTGSDWEERKLEELTGLKSTQDEVQRLTERMDTLVQIMSSVNWDRIDPQLTDTRESLEQAQQRLAILKAEGGAANQAEVAKEIEKLEAFVTSSKFRYYEMASRDGA